MKKRLLLCLMSIVLSVGSSFAQTPSLPLVAKPTNQGSVHNPLPKSPIQIPEVYLDGNTLSFDAAIEGCEVRLLDEDENVIFSDFIAISQTSLVLPSTLTGTFELQIIRGNFIFYCEIEL